MSDFNYKVRIPTDKEYDRFMDITDENNTTTHWDDMFSWIDDPEFIAEHPNLRLLRGYTSARYYDYYSAGHRYVNVGFRPAFEPLNNDTISAGIADGDVVVIGTLYMDGKPVKVPQNPTNSGDIEDYILGAKMEFKPAIDDSAYQVNAIKCGDIFICDRCLLMNISYNDICANFPANVGIQNIADNSAKMNADKNAINEMDFPELSMYDEEHHLELCRENAELDTGVYEVVFEACGERYYCSIDGCDSLLEALGLFFRDHPHITYDMIVNHEEV